MLLFGLTEGQPWWRRGVTPPSPGPDDERGRKLKTEQPLVTYFLYDADAYGASRLSQPMMI